MPGFQKRLVTLPLSEKWGSDWKLNENEKNSCHQVDWVPQLTCIWVSGESGLGNPTITKLIGSTLNTEGLRSWQLSCLKPIKLLPWWTCCYIKRVFLFNWKYYLSFASTIATILWWTGYVCNTQCVHWLHLQRLQDQSNWQEDYQVFMKWIEI